MTVSILSIFFCIAAVAVAVVAANYSSAYLLKKIPIQIEGDAAKTAWRILFPVLFTCYLLFETVVYFFLIHKPTLTETTSAPPASPNVPAQPAPLAIELPQGRLTAESDRQERHALLLEEESQLVRARFEHWLLATLPEQQNKKPEQAPPRSLPPPQRKPKEANKNKDTPPAAPRKNKQNNSPRPKFVDVKRYILEKMDAGDRYAFRIAMNIKDDNQSWTSPTTGIYYQVNMIKRNGYCQGYIISATINGRKYSYREPASRCR